MSNGNGLLRRTGRFARDVILKADRLENAPREELFRYASRRLGSRLPDYRSEGEAVPSRLSRPKTSARGTEYAGETAYRYGDRPTMESLMPQYYIRTRARDYLATRRKRSNQKSARKRSAKR